MSEQIPGPEPPTDIRVHLKDGSVITCEAVYTGDEWDEEEHQYMHIWEVVTTSIPIDMADMLKVTVGQMPGRTSIRFNTR